MLYVDRTVDVDPCHEQVMDVLPALGMTRAGNVGVSQFVHQDQRRAPRQCSVEIELLQHTAAIGDLTQGQPFETGDQRLCFLAAVGLDDADDDIAAKFLLPSRGTEHGVGLADAGRGAEENLQLAAGSFGFLFLNTRQELIGVRTSIVHHSHPRRRKRKKRNPIAPTISVSASG
jgi:hypothetical protein